MALVTVQVPRRSAAHQSAVGARTPKPPRLRECDRSFRFPVLAIRIFAAPKRASDRPNQLLRVRRIQFALFFCSRLRCGSGNLCLREGLIVDSLISQLQTRSENSFGSKVHPATRSSILGHRVSGKAIRSGGAPALIHAGKICRRRQGRDFHSARPRRLWKNPFSTSLLRSHYKGAAEVRPERRLRGRDSAGASESLARSPRILARKRKIPGVWGQRPQDVVPSDADLPLVCSANFTAVQSFRHPPRAPLPFALWLGSC